MWAYLFPLRGLLNPHYPPLKGPHKLPSPDHPGCFFTCWKVHCTRIDEKTIPRLFQDFRESKQRKTSKKHKDKYVFVVFSLFFLFFVGFVLFFLGFFTRVGFPNIPCKFHLFTPAKILPLSIFSVLTPDLLARFLVFFLARFLARSLTRVCWSPNKRVQCYRDGKVQCT